MMERLLQDEVETETGTRHHAMFGAVAAELDRATSRFLRQDPRPWRADVRRTASVTPADPNLEDVPFWEMVYGVPDQMVPRRVRTYEYSHQPGAYGIIGPEGNIVGPPEVDRAVETRKGLFLQVGSGLYRLTEEDPQPEEVSIDQTPAGRADRWTLTSISETERRLLVGEEKREEEVAAQIEGTSIQIHGTGNYKIDLEQTGVAAVSEGQDLGALPGYEEPLYLYNADGDRVSYTVSGGTLSIGPVIEESAIGGAGSGYALYYKARHRYSYRTPPAEPPVGRLREHKISFAEELEHFDRMPTADDISARQVIDRMCQVPAGDTVWVDGQGFVGDIAAGHPIEHVLLARHQVAVAGDDYLTVVEPAAGRIRFQQRYSEHDIVGLTWTKGADFGIVVASPEGFEVYALRPRRDARHENLTPSYAKE